MKVSLLLTNIKSLRGLIYTPPQRYKYWCYIVLFYLITSISYLFFNDIVQNPNIMKGINTPINILRQTNKTHVNIIKYSLNVHITPTVTYIPIHRIYYRNIKNIGINTNDTNTTTHILIKTQLYISQNITMV